MWLPNGVYANLWGKWDVKRAFFFISVLQGLVTILLLLFRYCCSPHSSYAHVITLEKKKEKEKFQSIKVFSDP